MTHKRFVGKFTGHSQKFPVASTGKVSIAVNIAGVFANRVDTFQSDFSAEFDSAIEGLDSTGWLETSLAGVFVGDVVWVLKSQTKK